MKKLQIKYGGRRITVKEVEESLDYKDLYYREDALLRDRGGNYYLQRKRAQKMPPNAEEIYDEQIARVMRRPQIDNDEVRRLRAFRDRHERPHLTVKRITEKTALLWCVRSMFNDPRIKARLRDTIRAT